MVGDLSFPVFDDKTPAGTMTQIAGTGFPMETAMEAPGQDPTIQRPNLPVKE